MRLGRKDDRKVSTYMSNRKKKKKRQEETTNEYKELKKQTIN